MFPPFARLCGIHRGTMAVFWIIRLPIIRLPVNLATEAAEPAVAGEWVSRWTKVEHLELGLGKTCWGKMADEWVADELF